MNYGSITGLVLRFVMAGGMCLFVEAQAEPTGARAAQKKGKTTKQLSVRKDKFRDIVRASKVIKASTAVGTGINFVEFTDLVRKFATEVEMLPQPRCDKEIVSSDMYKQALTIYKDCLKLWSAKIQDSSNKEVPKGKCRITKFEIDRDINLGKLVNKYGLLPCISKTDDQGRSLGEMWALDTGISIQIMLAKAELETEQANELVE